METLYHEIHKFKKGKIYDVSNAYIPKEAACSLFEGQGNYFYHPDFEKFTADKCIKSFTIEIKITA